MRSARAYQPPAPGGVPAYKVKSLMRMRVNHRLEAGLPATRSQDTVWSVALGVHRFRHEIGPPDTLFHVEDLFMSTATADAEPTVTESVTRSVLDGSKRLPSLSGSTR